MLVRTATSADAPAIAEIGRIAFPPTYAGSLDPSVIATVVDALYTDEGAAATVAASAADPDSRLFVLERDGRVEGFLHYDEQGPEPELHRIYLHPDAISTGGGSALMTALHDSLPHGKGYVLLVAANNDRAIAFYRRHGLTIREEVDGVEYYRTHMGVDIDADAEPYPAYIMQRTHDPARILDFSVPTPLPGGREWTAVLTGSEPDRMQLLFFRVTVRSADGSTTAFDASVTDPVDWAAEPARTRRDLGWRIRDQLGISYDDLPRA